MKIDLSCPAEIVKTELVRGEESWIRLILMNLTERGIDSCEDIADSVFDLLSPGEFIVVRCIHKKSPLNSYKKMSGCFAASDKTILLLCRERKQAVSRANGKVLRALRGAERTPGRS